MVTMAADALCEAALLCETEERAAKLRTYGFLCRGALFTGLEFSLVFDETSAADDSVTPLRPKGVWEVPRINVKAILLDVDMRNWMNVVRVCGFMYDAARETTRILTELWPSTSRC